MKLNENVKIIGKKVILIPYEAKHVPKYHNWMKNEELQELTASQPLTLEEEYVMQKTWRVDEDKLTFLVLDKAKFTETSDEIESLVGDTNLFLSINEHNSRVAEVEVMIAEKEHRGKGFGQESVLQLLRYAIDNLKINIFEAKIGFSNETSIRMFKKFGFTEKSRSEVFKEVNLTKLNDSDFRDLLHQTLEFKEEFYEK